MPNFSGMWTTTQQMQAKGQGIWTPVLPAIGAAYEGGFFAGQINQSANIFNLVVAPLSSGETIGPKWKNVNTATAGADSDIDGPQNTTDIVADGNSTVYPAGHFCNDLVIGGYTDWYLPAKNELEVCYYNLKPTTASNNTSSGINANAVPARASNYTAGNPAQTTASAFITSTGTESFRSADYWSSTESSATSGWVQFFVSGNQYTSYKDFTNRRVRAVRRVAV